MVPTKISSNSIPLSHSGQLLIQSEWRILVYGLSIITIKDILDESEKRLVCFTLPHLQVMHNKTDISCLVDRERKLYLDHKILRWETGIKFYSMAPEIDPMTSTCAQHPWTRQLKDFSWHQRTAFHTPTLAPFWVQEMRSIYSGEG